MIGRFLLTGISAVMLAACGAETPDCGADLPEIARGLPPDFAEGEAVLNARLRSRFPIGTPEKALVAELRKQGFPMPPVRDSEGNAYADSTCDGVISQTIWSVRWRAKEGRIVEIWGMYATRAP